MATVRIHCSGRICACAVVLELAALMSDAAPWYEREKPGNALLAVMCFGLAVMVANLGLLHLDDQRRAARRETPLVVVGWFYLALGAGFAAWGLLVAWSDHPTLAVALTAGSSWGWRTVWRWRVRRLARRRGALEVPISCYFPGSGRTHVARQFQLSCRAGTQRNSTGSPASSDR